MAPKKHTLIEQYIADLRHLARLSYPVLVNQGKEDVAEDLQAAFDRLAKALARAKPYL